MTDKKPPLEEENFNQADDTKEINNLSDISEPSFSEDLPPKKLAEQVQFPPTSGYEKRKEEELAKISQKIEANRPLTTKKQTRRWWIKTVLILLLCVGSILLMLTLGNYINDGQQLSFVGMLQQIRVNYFLLLIAIILLNMFLESMVYAYLLKVSTGKFRMRNSMKTMFLGKYYDGVTPLSTGGQPFQIYYLHKKDIPTGVASAVPLARYVITTVVWCLFSLVMLAIAPAFLGATSNVALSTSILVIAWISLAVNFAVPVTVVFVSIFPRTGKKLIIRIVWLLHKMRIVKNRYRTSKKWVYELGEYSNAIKTLFKRWTKLIPLFFLCLLQTLVNTAIPFFTVLALMPNNPPAELFLQMLCLCIVSQASADLFPTPGNSGAVELSTTFVFSTVVGIEPVLGWVVLIWRFFTYYVYIVTGIGINIFEIIRGAVRRNRALKLEQLQRNQEDETE